MYLKRYFPEAYNNKTLNKLSDANNQNNQSTNNGNKEQTPEEAHVELLWTITTALFVVGGMVGAFTSKYVLDFFGRKRGILFHYVFTLIGSILVFIAPLINSPECVMISRFFFGIQGGMACGLVPTYLSEISPSSLRGQTGVIHQLCLTIGILVAQTLGFRQLMGTSHLWHYLLAMPIVPAVLGGLVMIFFIPESPRALLIDNDDEHEARKALIKLRKTKDISDEIEEMNRESRESNSNEAISIMELFTLKELRWPLITGLIMQLAQQLCGINAVNLIFTM
jgi:SP family facilitated glucose transporter-like MFS transporter 1